VKLGLVSPRYGPGIVGGTEHWLRLLCEQLVARRGWQVDVYTTCATSAVTWADELAPGDSELAGVRVHRHRSRSGRSATYAPLDRLVRTAPAHVPGRLARRFVEAVGPVCPDAVEAAAGSDCDLVAVTPYLFWPTFAAVRALRRRVLFHPATHDEAELRLAATRDLFGAVGGISFNSRAERDLVAGRFPIGHLPQAVVGNTVVEQEGSASAARRWLGLEDDEPFVLCLGRVERPKGAHALAEAWDLYRRRRPGAPRLVLLGAVNEPLRPPPGVLLAGQCPEEVKWGALRAAEVLVTPSAWESFSLVVLEAWLAGTPVVVNGRCAATVEHCRRGGGGVWFDGYAELEVALDRLLAEPGLRAALAARGERYARQEFGWDRVLDRYGALAAGVRERWA
jgi:glycosyltransferase involved in cell wall biosynthesis